MNYALEAHFCSKRMDNCVGGKPNENLGVSIFKSRVVTLTHTNLAAFQQKFKVTQIHSFICISPSAHLEGLNFFIKVKIYALIIFCKFYSTVLRNA